MSSSTNNSTSDQQQQPGLISGHAQLAKGAIVGAVGSLTGSEAWTSSGQESKEAGISEMKAASENRDSSSQGYGKVEEIAGRATGCEGMEREGKESKNGS